MRIRDLYPKHFYRAMLQLGTANGLSAIDAKQTLELVNLDDKKSPRDNKSHYETVLVNLEKEIKKMKTKTTKTAKKSKTTKKKTKKTKA